MKFEIPKPLQAEHEELHATLARATQEPGAVGEAAREVARLLHPHFVREEQFALPPLALLSIRPRSLWASTLRLRAARSMRRFDLHQGQAKHAGLRVGVRKEPPCSSASTTSSC
ncbi:MAG TPA: hypothetical protein VLF42_03385 [Burkholderiales bacterium]|nr:hypothetical protein [Burkholderiales bacterium]